MSLTGSTVFVKSYNSVFVKVYMEDCPQKCAIFFVNDWVFFLKQIILEKGDRLKVYGLLFVYHERGSNIMIFPPVLIAL